MAFSILDDEIYHIQSYELDLVGTGHYLKEQPYDVLAYEVANKFQVSGHMSSEVIGMAKYFAMTKGMTILPVAQASWKKLISRQVLKKAGLYVPGTHAKDAAGVGLFAAVQLKEIKPWFLSGGDPVASS